jgi:hypothetical protein
MKLPIVVVGIIILVAGIALIAYGSMAVVTTTQVPQEKTATLYDNKFTIEGGASKETLENEAKSFTIDANRTVDGEITASKSIDFFVMDSISYDNWKSNTGTIEYIVSVRTTAGQKFKFSFNTAKSDTYHFVFDASDFPNDRDVTFKLNTTWTEITTQQSTSFDLRPIYLGVALAVIGGAIAVAGFLLKPKALPAPTPTPSTPTPPASLA